MNLSSIAFYNLENLFDVVDDPFTEDDDFTPEGKKRWTEKRYQNKVGKLAFAISKIGTDKTGQPPAILGLSEVENEHVIKDLINSNHIYQEHFGIVHYDSMDERGIDVALIYQKDQFLPLHSEPIQFNFENRDGSTDYTRDVLYVNGNFGNEIIHIFVVHLPSKRNKDINKPKRKLISEEINRRILEIHNQENAPHIIVMGDFNDNPSSENIKEPLNASSDSVNLLTKELYNPMQKLEKEGAGSMMHKKNWYLFDQILFSKAFFYNKSSVKLKSTHVFDEEFLKDWDERKHGEPFRTYLGKRYQNGYSDHFPVYAILENQYGNS